jgi:deoxyribonuclease V
MKVKKLHKWNLNTEEARELQIKLSKKVIRENGIKKVNYIAGVDVSILPDNMGRAAVVLLSYPEMEIVQLITKVEEVNFPYIPGLLSFREIPLLVKVLTELSKEPDIIFVDGQGIAHPRRFGLASHIGLLVNKPAIGCAKSLLCGYYKPVPDELGAFSHVLDENEIIGAALRTKVKTKPMFISIGHKVNLPASIEWVINVCRGYKQPEPTRLAHLASKNQI